MVARPKLPDGGDRREVKAELKAILDSRLFARAPSLSKLLAYLCEQSFLGRADSPKEYTIAVEALGRDPSFDPERDSIVRVEISRLRKRLALYYEGEGAAHSVRIAVPEGTYIPAFITRLPREAPAKHSNSQFPQEQGSQDLEGEPGGGRRWAIRLLRSRRFAVAAVLCAVALSWSLWPNGPVQGSSRQRAGSPAPPSAAPSPTTSEHGAVRILAGFAGAKYVDRMGHTWFGDQYFTGGAPLSRPIKRIFAAHDETLYRTARSGDFRYDIPLAPGLYELHLHFAEVWDLNFRLDSDGQDSRRFRVLMNGKPLLESFDIVSDAYGPNTADEKVFKDVSPASDGFLHLGFEADTNAAIISGIEILPGVKGKMLPVIIPCGAASYYDSAANSWGADKYFLGGVGLRRLLRGGDSASRAYPAERYGNFRYAIPTAEGSYRLTLRFVEAVFGFETDPGPGAGKRVFDVYCNGVALLRNFDIYKEAGGPGIPIERTFHRVRPNSQGKLLLSFVPVRNYATVAGIGVEDEGLP